MIFNYKDWWTWTFWIIFLYAFVDLLSNLDTLVRWKWGYYSIDLIPATLILLLLGWVNHEIGHHRYEKYIEQELDKCRKQEVKK